MSELDTMTSEYQSMVNELRKFFNSGQTKSIQWRKQQLAKVVEMHEKEFELIGETVVSDLGGAPNLRKIWAMAAHKEAKVMSKNLSKWSKGRKANHVGLSSLIGGNTRLLPQPKGVVLIIAPWNFPVNLLLTPMVNALAAGNAVVLKPSEIAPKTAQLMQDLVEKYLDPRWIRVVQGGIPETTALLRVQWDHIFYTGNGNVGRIIMQAAAKFLTPVSLELGGKSPCIVHRSAKLESAAERIVMGKYMNNGQICAAPDYVLVDEAVSEEFLKLVVKKYKECYSKELATNGHPYHGKMINPMHAKRVQALLDGLSLEAKILVQGEVIGTVEEGYVRPTVVFQPPQDDPIMHEEIFGPVLVIRTFSSLRDCVQQVSTYCDTPLCMYIFAESKVVVNRIIKATRSGQVTVNATLDALAVENFGGIGQSGTGGYHGKAGFDEFSYIRPIVTIENSIMSGGPIAPPVKGGYPKKPYEIAKAVTLYSGFKLVKKLFGALSA